VAPRAVEVIRIGTLARLHLHQVWPFYNLLTGKRAGGRSVGGLLQNRTEFAPKEGHRLTAVVRLCRIRIQSGCKALSSKTIPRSC
jgi:hypothetical protein